MTRVAVNGFGRIGRAALRTAFEGTRPSSSLRSTTSPTRATLATLLGHDTVYGPFPAEVSAREDTLVVDGTKIPVFADADPRLLPWRELGVDVVLECTGRFKKREQAAWHVEAGAHKVVISAPCPDSDATIRRGCQRARLRPRAAPRDLECFLHHELPRSRREDAPRGDRHRARIHVDDPRVHGRRTARRFAAQRSAARTCGSWNLVPTTTGAARAIGLDPLRLARRPDGRDVAPHLARGNLRGVPDRGRDHARGDPRLQARPARLLGHRQDVLLGPVVDGDLTAVVDGRQVHVVSWYDDEWGYATRLVELAERVFAPALV